MENKKLLIVADAGCVKMYRLDFEVGRSSPHFELIEETKTGIPGRVSENFSDQSGRCEGGGPARKAIHASGEKHNIKIELDKRAIKTIAARIEERAKSEERERKFWFASSKDIYNQILERLTEGARGRIVSVVPENLTHVHPSRLVEHFAVAGV